MFALTNFVVALAKILDIVLTLLYWLILIRALISWVSPEPFLVRTLLDLDKSGTIDSGELAALQTKKITLSFGDRLLELLSTHPNMLKRIKQLSA